MSVADRFPPLCESRVDVWLLPACRWMADEDEISSVLSPAELDRMARYRHEQRRLQYAFSRLTLRRLLGRYTGHSYRELALGHAEGGRPHLVCDAGIDFNVSHTAGLSVIAIALGRRVGVDIECRSQTIDALGAARVAFSPRDYQVLCTVDQQETADTFFRLWTRREACLKAAGRGLSEGAELVVSDVDGRPTPGVVDAPDGGASYAGFRIEDLTLGAGMAGAVCCSGTGWSVCLHAL